jgi:hypothetical protein
MKGGDFDAGIRAGLARILASPARSFGPKVIRRICPKALRTALLISNWRRAFVFPGAASPTMN